MPTVVTIGAANVDILCYAKRFPRKGYETVLKGMHISGGGSASNVAVGLARLKEKSGFIGKVGDDYFGRFLLKEFKKDGVDTSAVKVEKNVHSGTLLSIVDENGERTMLVSEGANSYLSPKDISKNYVQNAKILSLSSIEGKKVIPAMEKAARFARQAGADVFFDPGFIFIEKGIKELKGILRMTTIGKFNEDEIMELTNARNMKEAAKIVAGYGPKIVLVTLGKRGCYVHSDRTKRIVPTISPSFYKDFETIDKTGAGDAFSAGFIKARLNNWDISRCARFANLVASISITRKGARSVPSIVEIKKIANKTKYEV